MILQIFQEELIKKFRIHRWLVGHYGRYGLMDSMDAMDAMDCMDLMDLMDHMAFMDAGAAHKLRSF